MTRFCFQVSISHLEIHRARLSEFLTQKLTGQTTLLGLVSNVLSTFAWQAQIVAGMWRRNGQSVRYMVRLFDPGDISMHFFF